MKRTDLFIQFRLVMFPLVIRLLLIGFPLANSFSELDAATMSASADAPIVDGSDIANYDNSTGSDKWWVGSATSYGTAGMTIGQTFTTPSGAVEIRSVTFRIRNATQPTKTYTIRVGEITGNVFNEIASETASQTVATADDDYWTWTLDTPVVLNPGTLYGVDVGLNTSTSSWQSGIPYSHTATPGSYGGGSRFRSGSDGNGVGNDTIDQTSGDRVFHIDLAQPDGLLMEFVAGNPSDDSTNSLIPPQLTATFNKTLVAGSGNLKIRNLTDSSEEAIAINGPGVTLSDNLLLIDTAGRIDWNKSYAIQIEGGALESDEGDVFGGFTDDTTWNFATGDGDPLIIAAEALKDHVNGTASLPLTAIATHKATLDSNRQRFDESAATLSAVIDLVTAYEASEGPLFVAGSTVTEFHRNNSTPGDNRRATDDNIHWVILGVMQSIMDEVYHAGTLSNPATRNLLDGYYFGSSADFPGSVAAPVTPSTHVATIDASYPETFGRDTQHWEWPARKPTGTYLAPGSLVTLTVPSVMVNRGVQIRVGAHSWDHEAKNRPHVKRMSRASITYNVNATSMEIASPYGGGIYFEIPKGLELGQLDIGITGAVRSPYFSFKSFHTTSNHEWITTERNHAAPWADFQSEKFMMQVPTSWIYALDDPTSLMEDWDAAMDAINDLMGFPRIRGKETMYIQTDVILRSSVHAPGYPAINVSYNPKASYNGYMNNYFIRGPGTSASASHIEFHEQGHAYFFPKLGGETESVVNLLQPAMANRVFGYSFDEAHRGSLGSTDPDRSLDNTAVSWMCVFNFSPREVPMASAEKSYQHKGHAKFIDLARLLGWSGMDTYWRSFMEDDANGIPYQTDDDAHLLRLCKSYNKDIRPLFHFWGIHPQNPNALAADIAAEGIPPSLEIRDQLLRYKTLIPADNAAFRAFALAWWNRQPRMSGYWEEREHARQWDEEALYSTGDQQRTDSTNPGEMYNEFSASQISARIDALVALYFNDYNTWASQFPGWDLSDPNADLTGNGWTNNEARLFGLDPTASAANPYVTQLEPTSKTLTYTRRSPALTGATYEVWTSTNLIDWEHDETATQTPGPPNTSGVETVTVTLSKPAVDGRLFARIRAND